MDTLPSSLRQYFAGNCVDRCFIDPDCLDRPPVPTSSVCASRSRQAIARFFAAYRALASHQLMDERSIVQRALLFATEVLGSDHGLSDEQLAEKSTLHLLMAVQMTAQWLLDDTLDVRANMDRAVASQIIEYYLGLLEPEREHSLDAQLLEQTCVRHQIPAGFIAALTLLVRWQHDLAVAAGISLDPASMYFSINTRFMRSYLHAHSAFDSLESYFQHRSANGGLGVAILCGAWWFYRLGTVNHRGLDRHQEYYDRLIHRYSLIGSVSNDLFGYDKDLEEGVATGIEVAKQHLRGRSADREDEPLTLRAFALLIDIHNERLSELVEKCRTCDTPLERAVLAASLSTTWAVRVLHHEFMAIYRPRWLRRVLTQGPSASSRSTGPYRIPSRAKSRSAESPGAAAESEALR